MRMLVKLDVAKARPLRNGSEFWWQTILEKTADKPVFTYAEIDGASDCWFPRRTEPVGRIISIEN